jgi:hypothetical protein
MKLVRISLVVGLMYGLVACGQNAKFSENPERASLKSLGMLETIELTNELSEENVEDGVASADDLAEELDSEESSSHGKKNIKDEVTSEEETSPDDKSKKRVLCVRGQKFEYFSESARCGKNTSGHKVVVCHIPQGNIAAKHEICIDKHALPAHLEKSRTAADKDYLGQCI